MISITDMIEIMPRPGQTVAAADHVISGIPIPKPARILLFSPDDWEVFVLEWSTSIKDQYLLVRRFGGAGDKGVDIAGFCTEDRFDGAWDNFQCKHYDHPLRPSDAWVELGKVIYYSYCKEYAVPRAYYFVCPKGIGTRLEQYLNKPGQLKKKLEDNWSQYCSTKITSSKDIKLEGDFLKFFDSFNFGIFSSKSAVELIEQHSDTVFHSVTFGGGLPVRPEPDSPPSEPTTHESRYIAQLLVAYGENIGCAIASPSDLDKHHKHSADYLRQRLRFYHAESLRNWSRDTVPEGTFESLQEEIYQGVVDVCEDSHADGYKRMVATVSQSVSVATTSNPLVTRIKAQDRQGICHQLANDDRLKWTPDDD